VNAHPELLAAVRAKFGTVSGRSDHRGTVAVRNKTAALRELEAICSGKADVIQLTDGFPALCKIIVYEDGREEVR